MSTIWRNNPDAEYFFPEGCFILEMSNSETDPDVSIARARVRPGVTTQWHRLTGVSERYVILEGHGRMETGDAEPSELGPGDVVHIPAGVSQRITNLSNSSDLIFLAICSPRFQAECYQSDRD